MSHLLPTSQQHHHRLQPPPLCSLLIDPIPHPRPAYFFHRRTSLPAPPLLVPAAAHDTDNDSTAAAADSTSTTRSRQEDYANIEYLRREVEQAKGQPPFTISRTIKWLSDAANNGGSGLAFSAYRWVLGLDQPPEWTKGFSRPRDMDAIALLDIESRMQQRNPELLEALQSLLMIPRSTALKIVHRCPDAEAMSSHELFHRVVQLKAIFPRCNVARMVELVPSGFLAAPWDETVARVQCTNALLRSGLEGADVDEMFELDPTILFEDPESIVIGLRRLKELWKIDTRMMKNCDAEELALAVRALSLTGPPKKL